MMKISDIAMSVSAGGTPSRDKKEYWIRGDINWLKISDMKFTYISTTEEKITKLGLENSSAKIFPRGTVVYSIFATLGAVGILNVESATNQAIAGIIPKKEIIDTKYLYYCLRSERDKIISKKSHATQDNLNLSILRNHEIPVPPIDIQQKIVSILEKAEKLKDLRMEADKLTKDFLKAMFLDMFGDPAINPKNFPFLLLESIFSQKKDGVKCGPFGSALKKDEYVDSGIPVWTMDNIHENKFEPENCLFIPNKKYEKLMSYSVDADDIIISRAGTVGKMCVVHPNVTKSIISTNLIRLSLDSKKILPIYFTSLMTYCKGRIGKLETGADGSYTFMNTGVLSRLQIPLPPIELQNQFDFIVRQVEQLIKYQKQSKENIDNFFNDLMYKSFKGESVC